MNLESIKHFIDVHPVVAGCIVVIGGGCVVAVIVTLFKLFIGPDPAPTIKELDDARGGKE